MIRERKASNPSQPFFLYFAHGAVHAPLHAKPEPTSSSTAAATTTGGTRCASERYAPPAGAGRRPAGHRARRPATPSANHDVAAVGRPRPTASRSCSPGTWRSTPAWSTTSTRTSAGSSPRSTSMGELDNTIFVFTSDNGASREGEVAGTTAYYVHLLQGDDVDADLARIDLIGGPADHAALPAGLGDGVGNTPFRLYKINTHAGRPLGAVHRVVARRALGDRRAGEFRRQYPHVTDLLPDAARARRRRAADRAATARRSRPLAGASFAPTLADADGAEHAPRARRRDERPPRLLPRRLGGRHPAPAADAVRRRRVGALRPRRPTRPSSHDLAGDRAREASRELADAWEAAAWATRSTRSTRARAIKYLHAPERSDGVRASRSRSCAGTPTLERWRSVQLIWFRAVTITVDLDFARRRPGVLVAHGDQGGGLRALRARRRAVLRAQRRPRAHARGRPAAPLPDGAREVVADARPRPGGGSWDAHARRSTARCGPTHDGCADALRHGAVRGHRRRHRPPLAGVVGDLRALRPVPVHGHAALRDLRPGRARARRAGASHGHAARDGRQVRVRSADGARRAAGRS